MYVHVHRIFKYLVFVMSDTVFIHSHNILSYLHVHAVLLDAGSCCHRSISSAHSEQLPNIAHQWQGASSVAMHSRKKRIHQHY